MATSEYRTYGAADPIVGAVKRISWGAILAGGVVALVTQITLGLLGLGIGLSTVDPMQEGYPFAGLGIGAGIWFIVSSIISLFVGGWVAGRLAGIPKTKDSVLHGIVTWSVVTMLSFYLLTTAVGRVIGGTANVVGQGLALAGQGAAAVAPQLADAAQQQLQQQGITLQSIMEEAQTLLQQTGKEELQPENLRESAQRAADTAQGAAASAAQQPGQTGEELSQLISRVIGIGNEAASAADREALVNIIVERTDNSRQEAEQIVSRWEQTYGQVKQQTQQVLSAAEQQAREAGSAVASGVSKASLWTFASLLVGAASAAFGGKVGKPSRLAVGATTTTPGRRDDVV